MRILFAACALALAACEKAPEPAPPSAAASPEPAQPAQAATPAPAIEGWETVGAAHGLGMTVADFKLAKLGGGTGTRADLRGTWTIIGFWSATIAGVEEEVPFIRAINTAVDQDPDLDFLSVYVKQGADTDVGKWFANNGGNPWPTLIDKGGAANLFNIDTTPVYLLVGPDLTIEAWRGPLQETPDDGIKPVIRGVAEIKKQIAAPQ